ncbi:MAG: PQQ-binding-like beta-propeller repeat protein, partial [Verrucomicrobiota bacterium]|nr:PQQ-binding-like beta-propeller repeat protein [Verrucomicrobiota bacterium]
LWEFETGGNINCAPAIGSDGIIYIGSDDNKLYAIATSSKGLADSPWPMFGQNAQHTGRTITGSHKKFRLNQIKEYELRSLNENPSFEQGKSGWVPDGGEIILVPNNNDLAGGKNALTLKKPAGYGRLGTANKINLKAGKKYRTIIVLTDEIDIPRTAGDSLVQHSGGVVMGNDTYTTYHSGGKTILDQVISFPEDRSLHFQYALRTKEQITFEHFFIVEERNTTSVIPNSPEAAAAIEAAIRKAAGKSTGALTDDELLKITTIHIQGSHDFSNFGPIAKLKNLQDFRASGTKENPITSLRFLEGLKNLHTIHLSETSLTSVESSGKLPKLRELFLVRNQLELTDLTALGDLPELVSLKLDGSNVTSIKGLGASKSLTSLILAYHDNGRSRMENKINNLDELASLKQLKELALNGNPITDLSVLSQLENLAALYLGDVLAQDLSPIAKLKNLQDFRADGTKENPITSLSFLEGLKNLHTIHLSETSLTSVESLGKLPNLRELLLRRNRIELNDLTALGGLPELISLKLDGSNVTSIKGLGASKSLTSLNLAGNFNGRSRMENKINNLGELVTLKQLKELRLEGNPDLTVAQIEELQKELPNCQITHDAKK